MGVSHTRLLTMLRATPEQAAETVRGLTSAQAQRRPIPNEWSCVEMLDHLLVGERDVILPRLRRMRAEDHPVFPSSAATRTGFAATPRVGELHERLDGFRAVRA
jgi:DinB superfamily